MAHSPQFAQRDPKADTLISPYSAEALQAIKTDLAARPRQLFINGAFVDAASGERFDVVDPATGQSFAKAASGGAEDIDRALSAARAAFAG